MVLQATTTVNGADAGSAERQNLLTRLLDSVKQCQVRFGGRSELATETDSRVNCLCAAWEAALQHGMKHSNKALSTIKQVTEMTGLSKLSGIRMVDDIRNLETEPSFWQYAKEHLNKHESQRFHMLKNVSTDAGRGRAWLRSSFNEHSLEKYMHMLLESDDHLSQFYEDWSFLRDSERSSMMPMMAAGLGSILFAIGIDNPELNAIKAATGLDSILNSNIASTSPLNVYAPRADDEPMPVIAASSISHSPTYEKKKKERKMKKKIAHVVSFDDGESIASSTGSITSPSAWSSQSFDLGVQVTRAATNTSSVSEEDFKLSRQSSKESIGSQGYDSESKLLNNDLDHVAQPSLDEGNRSQVSPLAKAHVRNRSLGSLQYSMQINNKINSDVTLHDSAGSLPLMKTLSSNEVVKANNTIKNTLANQQKSFYTLSSQDSKQLDFAHSISKTKENQCNSDSVERKIALVKQASSDPLDNPTQSSTGDLISELLATNEPKALLIPVSGEGAIYDSILTVPSSSAEDSISYDSYDLPNSYSEDIDNATFALQLAQKGLDSSTEIPTSEASTFTSMPIYSKMHDNMSTAELKQAVVAMMLRKDEVEEQNKSLQYALDIEHETVAALHMQNDDLSKKALITKEKDEQRIKSLTKENELLKHQLRKYVSAVQMLRTQGAKADVSYLSGIHIEDSQPAIPPPPPSIGIDYSHEASEYQRKLIQVAEMHGELMEFNELLHRQLNYKETQVKHLKDELTQLRGPLPEVFTVDEDGSICADYDGSSIKERSLINVWIPSAFFRGTGSDAYHVYQVYIRIRDQEWNVYRRYADFLDLHVKLKKVIPSVSKFQFPAKRAIGNKNAKFVEERRKKLQIYIREVINCLSQNHPKLNDDINRETLVQLLPFFGDHSKPDKSKGKLKQGKKDKKATNGKEEQTQASSQYMGL